MKNTYDYKLNIYANKLKDKYFKNNKNAKKIIFHIDVNSAFLSWTAVDLLRKGYNKDIRNIPSAICYDIASRKSIILAKSYIAKSFGVKTGEPLSEALAKCSNIKIFPPNYELFSKSSKDFFSFLNKYTYMLEKYSIDECFLDMTDFLFGKSPENLASEIKKDIYENLGFTVNIGIGNSKVMAKTASGFEKPNKINTLYDYEIETKLWPLDISNLFMMGKKTQQKLRKIGINKISELANAPFSNITHILGKNGDLLWKYANGIDNSPVIFKKVKAKSISNSETLPINTKDKEYILNKLIDLTLKVVSRLQKENLFCKTISVEFRTDDFIDFGKAFSLNHYTNITNEIISIVKKIADEIYFEKTNDKKLNKKILKNSGEVKDIRLIGIKLSNLSSNEFSEKNLFELLENKKNTYLEKNKKLDNVVNNLKDKFGENAIKRARNISYKKEDNLLM